jgi:hypothetical protein
MNRLYRIYKERLKFYILILLVITSVVQLGILWKYQNQGLPFNFMYLFSNSQPTADDTQLLHDFFTPYKVIISEGFDSPKWIFNKNDSSYQVLWKDAKYYLGNAFKMKSDKIDAELEDWYDLIDKKVFVFEFKTPIKTQLLKNFLDISETSPNSPTGIYKMIISPWEETTSFNSNIIYVNDGINIYRYDMPFYSGGKLFDKDQYDKIINDYSLKDDLINYSFLKPIKDDSIRSFKDDITVVISGNKNRDYKSVASTLFPGFGTNEHDEDRLANVALKILGSERDNYDRSIDDDDKTIELKTLDNIYKVYADGLMEYKYVPEQSSIDKGDIKLAFKNAFDFVQKLELESENNISLFLSEYKAEEKYYEFRLDYMVSDESNDVPIYFNYDYKDPKGVNTKLHNAIIIRANSKNVLSCTAIIKSFVFTGDVKQYGIGWSDAMFLRTDLLHDKNTPDKEVSISYEMGNEAESAELKLVWVIKADDNYYTTPMIIK